MLLNWRMGSVEFEYRAWNQNGQTPLLSLEQNGKQCAKRPFSVHKENGDGKCVRRGVRFLFYSVFVFCHRRSLKYVLQHPHS